MKYIFDRDIFNFLDSLSTYHKSIDGIEIMLPPDMYKVARQEAEDCEGFFSLGSDSFGLEFENGVVRISLATHLG